MIAVVCLFAVSDFLVVGVFDLRLGHTAQERIIDRLRRDGTEVLRGGEVLAVQFGLTHFELRRSLHLLGNRLHNTLPHFEHRILLRLGNGGTLPAYDEVIGLEGIDPFRRSGGIQPYRQEQRSDDRQYNTHITTS